MGATFIWATDADTGVYKNHKLSGELLKLAALQWKFVPFTQKIKAFGKKMGESITMPYYKPLTIPSNNGELEETTRIPIDSLTMGHYTITVKEWGRAVEFTSFAEDLSLLSPKEGAQKALTTQMQECMDNAAAAAFKGTNAKIAFIPTSLTGGTWDTDGTASTTALQNLTKAHMGLIRDYMMNDIHVPFYESEWYIGLMSTTPLRGLRDDRVIQAFNLYLQKGDLLYRGEIGNVENIRLIEVNNANALDNTIGSSNVLGEGVIFGEGAVGRVEIDYPELRAQVNYNSDFGRRNAVAWYGTVAFDVMFQSATDRECRIVKLASA